MCWEDSGRQAGGRVRSRLSRQSRVLTGDANVTQGWIVLVILKITALPTPQRLGKEVQCLREKNRFSYPSVVCALMDRLGGRHMNKQSCIPRSEVMGSSDLSPAHHSSFGGGRMGQRTQLSLLWRSRLPCCNAIMDVSRALTQLFLPFLMVSFCQKLSLLPSFPTWSPLKKSFKPLPVWLSG